METKEVMVKFVRKETEKRKGISVEYKLSDLLKFIRSEMQSALEIAGIKMEVPPVEPKAWSAMTEAKKTEYIASYHVSLGNNGSRRNPLLGILKKYIPLDSQLQTMDLEKAIKEIVKDCNMLQSDKSAGIAILAAIKNSRESDQRSNAGR